MPMHSKEQEHQENEHTAIEIFADCPKCGGLNRWELFQVYNTCEWCSSTLWRPRDPNTVQFLTARNRVDSPEDIIDVLGTYDAMKERARLLASLREGHKETYSDFGSWLSGGRSQVSLMDQILQAGIPNIIQLKKERRHLFQVHEYHQLNVPYLLISTELLYHVLGRPHEVDKKVHRAIGCRMEEIIPAYPAPWNFRDTGLWVTSQRFHTLQAEGFDPSLYMEPKKIELDLQNLIRKWIHQSAVLKPELNPIHFECVLLPPNRWIVYRPYIYTYATTPESTRWFIIDGQFKTIAGNPKDTEIAHVREKKWQPLSISHFKPKTILHLGFRCPECGWDISYRGRGIYLLCKNCGRILNASMDGLREVPYFTLDREYVDPWVIERSNHVGYAWLPYWRYSGTWYGPRGEESNIIPLLLSSFPPDGHWKRLLPDSMDSLYIPAFNCLQFVTYETWAMAFASYLSTLKIDPLPARLIVEIALDNKDWWLAPDQEKDSFKTQLSHFIASLLPKPLQTQLNPMILKKLNAIRYQGNPQLVYVPAPLLQVNENLQIIGPDGIVPWTPLKTNSLPPDLVRETRRWRWKSEDSRTENKDIRIPRLPTHVWLDFSF